jgi:hypothetical protein
MLVIAPDVELAAGGDAVPLAGVPDVPAPLPEGAGELAPVAFAVAWKASNVAFAFALIAKTIP